MAFVVHSACRAAMFVRTTLLLLSRQRCGKAT